MFKSKTSYLVFSIILMALAVISIVYVSVNWSRLMESNRMSLFTSIIWAVLFAYKAFDNFWEWRNHGKPIAEEE